MITFATAIQSLRPGVEWRLEGENIADIEWLTPGVAQLTQEEVDAEIARLQNEAAQKAIDRAEALRKMAQASGLNEAELAALGF